MANEAFTSTIPNEPGTLLSYADARKALDRHPLRGRDVPIEHEISLPVPTTRWATPVYAVFAGAAFRHPGTPKELAVPDRWWAIGARSGRLVAYNLASAIPFAHAPLDGPVTVPPTGRPVRAALNDIRVLGELMDQAVPAFLDRALTLPATVPSDLQHLWRAVVPAVTSGWYRALAPDFFTWLDSGGKHS